MSNSTKSRGLLVSWLEKNSSTTNLPKQHLRQYVLFFVLDNQQQAALWFRNPSPRHYDFKQKSGGMQSPGLPSTLPAVSFMGWGVSSLPVGSSQNSPIPRLVKEPHECFRIVGEWGYGDSGLGCRWSHLQTSYHIQRVGLSASSQWTTSEIRD